MNTIESTDCDIHQFFKMLNKLGIHDSEYDMTQEAYDMIGHEIVEDFKDVVLLKTRTKRWIEWR